MAQTTRRRQRRHLPIGVNLAVRYTFAMLATVTALGLFVYAQISERINRQGTLALEISLQDSVDAFESQSREHSREYLLEWFDQQIRRRIAVSPADLELGIELLDRKGERLLAAGSLAKRSLPVSVELTSGARGRVLRAVDLGGNHAHLIAAAPVSLGFIRVAMDTQQFADNIHAFRRIFLVTLPFLLASTALLGWFLARASLRPIHAINRTARRISGEHLEERIPTHGSGDELDQLADTLNEMLGRLRESLGRERRFTGNAAHQLLTPLAAIRNQVDVTLDHERSEREYRRTLEGVRSEANRLADAVGAMLRLARSEEGLSHVRRELHSLAPVLETVVDFFRPLAAEKQIELTLIASAELEVWGDAGWLSEMFQNLLSNAIKFTPHKGQVHLAAEHRGDTIVVEVRDTGPGFEAGGSETVFERFARAKNTGAPGVGLGLPIAREIARAHRGDLRAESSAEGGATFIVTLPAAYASGSAGDRKSTEIRKG